MRLDTEFLMAHDYTRFATLDIDKECESAYFQHHRLLNEFAAGTNADTKAASKAIRPMLEGYLHRRFPSLVPKSLMFGQVVVLIRDADAASPLRHAQSLVAELNGTTSMNMPASFIMTRTPAQIRRWLLRPSSKRSLFGRFISFTVGCR